MSVNKNKLIQEIFGEKKDWSPVPHKLWTAPIKASSKAVWCFIASQSEKWEPSYPDIAHGTGLSESSVLRSVKELVRAKMLYINPRPAGLRNEYVINSTKEWDFDGILGFLEK